MATQGAVDASERRLATSDETAAVAYQPPSRVRPAPSSSLPGTVASDILRNGHLENAGWVCGAVDNIAETGLAENMTAR
jgi:hypothetical protein